MIAHTRVKTPTAAAAFFIDRLHQVDERIDQLRERIVRKATSHLQLEQMKILHLAQRIPALFAVVKTTQGARLDRLVNQARMAALSRVEREARILERVANRIRPAVVQKMTAQQHRLEIMEKRLEAVDPQRILERGYSITMLEGKAVTSTDCIKSGDTLETRVKDGIIQSVAK